ncbi:uncharacterized protein LAJ45_01200 [Morchella importuna]|uniref:uncharacterized protein n=1 Tax=Morchella importuna TaxID=1174673 RepID=UPI001E8DE99B|nr:uncharacterized protein LAJ45_01200 [Morchella importuna]KAH8154671.1 hypothetical protein LAJ45_01200 [Morchella importuna]
MHPPFISSPNDHQAIHCHTQRWSIALSATSVDRTLHCPPVMASHSPTAPPLPTPDRHRLSLGLGMAITSRTGRLVVRVV